MNSALVDLRSEAAAPIDEEMRRSMYLATAGCDAYDEDQSVQELEETVAQLFSMDGAVFVPTGRMANLIGIRLLTEPGFDLVTDADAHIVTAEYGAIARFWGVQTRTFRSDGGRVRVNDVLPLIQPTVTAAGAVVAVENTHLGAGGAVQPLDELRRISDTVHAAGHRMYCDGARIWYAARTGAGGYSPFGALFDCLSVSLVKGIGAPVGAVCLYNGDRLDVARHVRRMLGGGWSRPGALAQAGLLGLRRSLDRLEADVHKAYRLSQLLREHLPQGEVVQETNIVTLRVPDAMHFYDVCREQGVLLFRAGTQCVRAVLHHGVSATAVEAAAKVMTKSYLSLNGSDRDAAVADMESTG